MFHWSDIRNNGVEPNKNYIKTKYIISNPDKFDGYLLGSSRIGSIHVDNIKNEKIYNMTYSSGTPHENLETLQTFIKKGIDIKTIYLGLDSLSYTENFETHNNERMRASYKYLTENILDMIYMYLDPLVILQSISTVMSGKEIDSINEFYDYGWWCEYGRPTEIDWKYAAPSYGDAFLMQETLDDIFEIKKLCEQNDIKLIVFTNPMYGLTYVESVYKLEYLKFLENLANITDYYNFSGLNSITTNTKNYIDTSHYNAYIGDLLIDIMVNHKSYSELEKKGFGYYVTKDNIKELLEILKTK